MQVRCGDTVKLRDGRIVEVTDAADRDPEAYRWYDDGGALVQSLPHETIFIGTEVGTGKTVVSDMSEVVSIIN